MGKADLSWARIQHYYYYKVHETHEEKTSPSSVFHGLHDFDHSLFPDIKSDFFSLSVD